MTQDTANHQVSFQAETRELFYVILALIGVIITLTGVIITCHVAQCHRRATRRKRRDETIKSLQRRFQYRPYGGSYSLPDVQIDDSGPLRTNPLRQLFNTPDPSSNVRATSFRFRDGWGRERPHPSIYNGEHEQFLGGDNLRSPSLDLD